MRQAGRSLPEYRELRSRFSFWEVCRAPELAAEVSLQPLRRFPLDAAIVFSDILVVPAAMGQTVEIFPEMSLDPPVHGLTEVARFRSPETTHALGYVAEAIRIVRRELGRERALLGFSGAPFTLACYMIEGGSSRYFRRTKEMMYRDRVSFDTLMDRVSAVVADYLELQVEASADAVQLFDTWAGELSARDYREYVLPHVQGIVDRLHKRGTPVIYYINGMSHLLEAAHDCGADVLGLDWRIDLIEACSRLGSPRPAVQGNLDPGVLFAPEATIRMKVFDMVDATQGRGHIANLGHGLLPDTPLEGIDAFVRAVVDTGKVPRNSMESYAG